jgi:hypothetical protein
MAKAQAESPGIASISTEHENTSTLAFVRSNLDDSLPSSGVESEMRPLVALSLPELQELAKQLKLSCKGKENTLRKENYKLL